MVAMPSSIMSSRSVASSWASKLEEAHKFRDWSKHSKSGIKNNPHIWEVVNQQLGEMELHFNGTNPMSQIVDAGKLNLAKTAWLKVCDVSGTARGGGGGGLIFLNKK